MSTRVAIVGDPVSVAGFRPLGFAAYAVEDPQAARELWPELADGSFGVVFLTEPVYSALEDLVTQVSDRPFPAVTVVPGAGSPGGVGQAKLDRAIVRALGTTVPFREEEG